MMEQQQEKNILRAEFLGTLLGIKKNSDILTTIFIEIFVYSKKGCQRS
jgi:hypothetical protein